MGSKIEINDTLKLTYEEGLPRELKTSEVYEFCKSERRLYHLSPTRVFLVEERHGLWNFIGHAHIVELTIDAVKEQTRGKFLISKLYSREVSMMLNKHEAPEGKSFLSK